MRKLWSLLVVLTIIIGGLGVYRGWFVVSNDHNADKVDIELSVDRKKMRNDVEKAEEKAKELTGQTKKTVRP